PRPQSPEALTPSLSHFVGEGELAEAGFFWGHKPHGAPPHPIHRTGTERGPVSTGVNATDSVVNAERSPLSDAALVAAARGGDTRAFERLYRQHSGKVMGLCLRMTRRRDIAEDCVQQTFIRAWRNLASFEGRSALGTWLHRIAVNEVLTYARN